MNSSKLLDWVTIATNIGIILSLVFLGLQYRQNSELLALERNAFRTNSLNSVSDLVIQDVSLIELMRKDQSSLTQTESDRLLLLGLRMLQHMEGRYTAAIASGLPPSSVAVSMRSVYNRPRLNYGLQYAWETYKTRGETDFTKWFEREVVNHPP